MVFFVCTLLMPFSMALNGLVLRMLWGWFVVPVTGLPPLSVAQAVGVGLVVGFLTHQFQFYDEEKNKEFLVRGTIYSFLKPVVGLLAGYSVHLFL